MSPLSRSKHVSRSFYLSLRLLPVPMRNAAAVGYLLARASDTVADSAGSSAQARLHALQEFARAVAGSGPSPVWTAALLTGIPDLHERDLLEDTPALLAMLATLPAPEADLVREVVAIIISGQALDLTRFGDAGADRPVALPDAAALDDYTWRVAGCVGEFWTKLGLLTLGNGFANSTADTLLPMARAYGTGLQLVNILRDLPRDLAAGRCYLPVADPHDQQALWEQHALWRAKARDAVAQGLSYSARLLPRRLRAASILPALLANETLDLLDGADWQTLESRVKVPRSRVYLLLLKALCA
jgi:farnesyl-diphosphate farnesyltransferase